MAEVLGFGVGSHWKKCQEVECEWVGKLVLKEQNTKKIAHNNYEIFFFFFL